MDGWVRVLRSFNSISVISRRWKSEHERLCAMKHRLGSRRISPPAGFERVTPWSEVGSANRSATRTLQYCDEAKMRTRQKRVATDTWRFLGCRTTPLEHWSKRKPTVEPRLAKQQTKKLRPKPTKINSFMSGHHWVWRPTHRRAIKEGSKVINRDCVKH